MNPFTKPFSFRAFRHLAILATLAAALSTGAAQPARAQCLGCSTIQNLLGYLASINLAQEFISQRSYVGFDPRTGQQIYLWNNGYYDEKFTPVTAQTKRDLDAGNFSKLPLEAAGTKFGFVR